jgi:glycosyltransferase involved in cell wall biosynthesis
MKIWIAVHHFPPRFTGGAEWRAYRTAKAIQQHGDEVQVMCVEHIDRSEKQFLDWMDDVYEGIPVRRIDINLVKAKDPFHLKYDNPWIREAMGEWLNKDKPDLLHLIGGYLMSASPLHLAFQQRIPTVVTLTDYWFLCPRINMVRSDNRAASLPVRAEACARCLGEEKRRFLWLGKMFPEIMSSYWSRQTGKIEQLRERLKFLVETLNKVDLIICPSKFLRSVYIQSGVDPEKLFFLRQGVNLSEVKIAEKTARPGTIRIGYLGQIAPHKGVHLIPEAIRKLPDLDLEVKIYGDIKHFPRYGADLVKMADQDRRIRIMGTYRGSKELNGVMAELDIMVVPSIWYENSPNAILESFAYRTPVIVSDYGGMSELIQHRKNGLLFNTGDSDDLAEQIKSLFIDPELLLHLRKGIEPVKDLTTEMAELIEIYRKAIAVKQALPVCIN